MQGFTNYEEMFAQSIGLKEPWYIQKAEFDEAKREVHIYVGARKTAKYECPKCGKLCKRYDDEETERVWRHGDVVFFPCYVHCRRPRVKCEKDGYSVVTAPWARPGSRYTLLFESYAMLLGWCLCRDAHRSELCKSEPYVYEKDFKILGKQSGRV